MLAVRAEARDLRVLELREADPALVDGRAHQRALHARAPVPYRPATMHGDAPRGRHLERVRVEQERILRCRGCDELGDAE